MAHRPLPQRPGRTRLKATAATASSAAAGLVPGELPASWCPWRRIFQEELSREVRHPPAEHFDSPAAGTLAISYIHVDNPGCGPDGPGLPHLPRGLCDREQMCTFVRDPVYRRSELGSGAPTNLAVRKNPPHLTFPRTKTGQPLELPGENRRPPSASFHHSVETRSQTQAVAEAPPRGDLELQNPKSSCETESTCRGLTVRGVHADQGGKQCGPSGAASPHGP